MGNSPRFAWASRVRLERKPRGGCGERKQIRSGNTEMQVCIIRTSCTETAHLGVPFDFANRKGYRKTRSIFAGLLSFAHCSQMTSTLSQIVWPKGFEPGLTDNFASNEVIVAGLDAAAVWRCLNNTDEWPGYYSNASDIRFPNDDGPELSQDVYFRFSTFGFAVEAKVIEWQPPTDGKPGRVSWHGWVEGDQDHRLDVIHAWIIEDLSHNRVRILTQETQNGKPAKEMASVLPNPMINGHQEWLVGLVKCARSKRLA